MYASTFVGLETHSGAYLEDCRVSQADKHGQDPEMARKLWASTEEQIQAALSKS